MGYLIKGDIVVNKENDCDYVVLSLKVINETNIADSEIMVAYYDSNGQMYVIEISEFFAKFNLK